ncbi:MAG: N-acyl-L-amino acid amidohydrolase [Frankiales bacterium]|nr:N-acyl-L-amino acid amidohydrolase [Frankiales bacterium]
MSTSSSLLATANEWLSAHSPQLRDWRRDLHAHPEVGFNEYRTTDVLCDLLSGFGFSPKRFSSGTGVICDVAAADPDAAQRPIIALRADIDALPLPDLKPVPYASQNEGVCHACGHDAHTAILLGVAGVFSRFADSRGLPGPVRLIFQPAEERMPGGSMLAVAEGALEGVGSIYALHCDPRLDAGQVGLRVGPITAAFDQLDIRLHGPGGHTARPQLTADLVYAMGLLITELPGLLSRRVDPRAALSLVWGAAAAGSAANAIPRTGVLRGTLRMLDSELWESISLLVTELIHQIVAPTGVTAEIGYERGVPAVTNDPDLVAIQTAAATLALGAAAVAPTSQSMGGEDFAWYLRTVPGAMARLGTRIPGAEGGDLHQSSFDIDESALAVGVRFTTAIVAQSWAS